MKLARLLKEYKYVVIFVCGYVLLRILLININITEWGDSFRILRAAKALLHFSYPLDEKRLPVFSALLAPGLLFWEPVLWGRIYAILAAVVNLVLATILFKLIYPKAKQAHLLTVILLLALNPIFFYWSLRIMAETTFTIFVLLAFVVYLADREHLRYSCYVLGVIIALASLTRYEGFLLAGAFGLGYLAKKDWRRLIKVFSAWLVVVAPWFVLTKLVLSGGTSDAYVSELQTFNFGFYRLGYFLTYSLFFIGSPILLGLLILDVYPRIIKFKAKTNFLGLVTNPIVIFVFLEFALFFVWTPSLPRIMLPIIPLAVIMVVKTLVGLDLKDAAVLRRLLLVSAASTICYLLLQFKFKLYFLVLSYFGLGLILILSFLALLGMWLGSRKLLVGSVALTLALGSFVVVANQRLVYSTVYAASLATRDLEGNIAYSDETGVTSWYLGSRGVSLPQNIELTLDEQQAWLWKNDVKYILDTNEFNRGSKLAVTSLTCGPRFEETIADYLDSLLIKCGLMVRRDYPILYSQLCKV